MAFIHEKHIKIVGVSACVPKYIQDVSNIEVLSIEEAQKFTSSTGIERRRISNKEITTSDLCYSAAKKLLNDINWDKETVDCLIFVSQTPDYILPATSCILQNRLKFRNDIIALDISLGCSGWIYGLMTISSLIKSANFKRGILLVGDTISKTCSENDKSTFPLFGDAGTATAIEFDEEHVGIKFHLETDGSGFDSIIIPDGGYRNIFSDKSVINVNFETGITRSPVNLVLDGMNVFSFGINKAPQSINSLLNYFKIDKESIDIYLFHQANLFMNEKIRKKLNLPIEKVPYSLKNFGNTSSATIVLTMISELKELLKIKRCSIIACGFGVGLSWGSVWFETEKIICPDLIEI